MTVKLSKCIHCESEELYHHKAKASAINAMNISTFSSATLDIYVCGNCGHVHPFLQDEAKLSEVKKKWSKVN